MVGGVVVGEKALWVSLQSDGKSFCVTLLFLYQVESRKPSRYDITHASLLTSISGILMAGFGYIDIP